MSYFITPDLGLQLADPLTIQAFETTNVNGNFMLLESAIMADRAQLLSHQNSINAFNAGAGRGTAAIRAFATLAQLNAAHAAALDGDIAMVSTVPTTGTARWMYFYKRPGSTWRPYGNPRFFGLAEADQFKTDIAGLTNIQTDVGTIFFLDNENRYGRWIAADGSWVVDRINGSQLMAEDIVGVGTANAVGDNAVIGTIVFASLPVATVVMLEVKAKGGFSGVAASLALDIAVSAGSIVTQSNQTVQSNGGAFTEVERLGKITIPANTAVTATVRGRTDQATTYWRCDAHYRRLTA